MGSTKNNLYLRGWKANCLPTRLGGLGIQGAEKANITTLSRLRWRVLTNENNLSSPILKGKHFYNTKPIFACKLKKHSSWFWKSCLIMIKTIMEFSLWDVGKGDIIDIWIETWIPNTQGSLVLFFGPHPYGTLTPTHNHIKMERSSPEISILRLPYPLHSQHLH